MDMTAIFISLSIQGVLFLIISSVTIFLLLKKSEITLLTAFLTSLVSVFLGMVLGGVLGMLGNFLTYIGTYGGFLGGYYLMLGTWKKVDKETLNKTSWKWLLVMVVSNIIISLISVFVLAYFGFLSP